MPDSPATLPEPQDHEGEQEDVVTDPGGRLQDITDPALRSKVASMRGRKGGARGASASKHEPGKAGKPGSRTVEPSAPQSFRATDRAVLESIRDDKRALPSDRIRAVEGLGKLDAQEHSATGGGDIAEEWRAMGEALEKLPMPERLAFLREAAGLATATEEEGGGEASPRSDGTPT